MASASSGSDSFSGQPGMSNWEQKIVEFRLYRDSTISNKSLASVSFKGYRSHSLIMGPVKIYAQNCLQVPADLKSAGNRGVVQSRLQVLHVHVFLVAPLGTCHVA